MVGGVSTPLLFGRIESLRDPELEVRKGGDGKTPCLLGGVSSKHVRFLVPGGAGVALDPDDGCRTAPPPEKRDYLMKGEGVALPGSCSRMSGAGNGAHRI